MAHFNRRLEYGPGICPIMMSLFIFGVNKTNVKKEIMLHDLGIFMPNITMLPPKQPLQKKKTHTASIL